MIKIEKEIISGALNIAGSVIKKNNLVPMAENIHLTCKDGKLRIRSTDIENQYESTMNVDGDDEFEFSLPSPEFIGTILKLNKEEFDDMYKHIQISNYRPGAKNLGQHFYIDFISTVFVKEINRSSRIMVEEWMKKDGK